MSDNLLGRPPGRFTQHRRLDKLREILALGERIAFRDGERIVHVKPAAGPGETAK